MYLILCPPESTWNSKVCQFVSLSVCQSVLTWSVLVSGRRWDLPSLRSRFLSPGRRPHRGSRDSSAVGFLQARSCLWRCCRYPRWWWGDWSPAECWQTEPPRRWGMRYSCPSQSPRSSSVWSSRQDWADRPECGRCQKSTVRTTTQGSAEISPDLYLSHSLEKSNVNTRNAAGHYFAHRKGSTERRR